MRDLSSSMGARWPQARVYAGEGVCIAPVIGCSGSATQLDLYTLLHQAAKQFCVGIPV
jgi:hypothetical protein